MASILAAKMLHIRGAGHDHAEDHATEALAAGAAECGPESMDSYNLALHIGAIFIMMAVSIAGFCIPHLLVASSAKNMRVKNLVIEMGKAFGTGVVITTGFIHMLMEAAHEFDNECAPYIFHEYEGWAFAICIFTIFCVQALEFFMTRSFLPAALGSNPHSHSTHDVDIEGDHHVPTLVTKTHEHTGHSRDTERATTAALKVSASPDESMPMMDSDSLSLDYGTHRAPTRPITPCLPRDCVPGCVDNVAVMVMPSASHLPDGEEHCATLITEPCNNNQELSVDEIQRIKYVHVDPAVLGLGMADHKADDTVNSAAAAPLACQHGHGHGHVHGHIHIHRHDAATASRMQKLRKRVAVMVLECGIAVHSVIIGLTLGVQPDGSNFTALLIALCFHQFFEGWALAEATRDAQYKSMRPVIATGIFYALTTPVGVAIGVGIHGTYNANSATSITLLGVLDSICAGILIYMGLVQFMSAWFTNNEEFMRKPLWHIFCVYLALLAGMLAMASIGIWA